jgi:Family of unknown function (DUF5654)
MADERKLTIGEVRKTIATSLGTAFGLVIGLLWNQVVQGGLGLASINTTAPKDPLAYGYFILTAVVVTVVMIVFIILVGRWGSKT